MILRIIVSQHIDYKKYQKVVHSANDNAKLIFNQHEGQNKMPKFEDAKKVKNFDDSYACI